MVHEESREYELILLGATGYTGKLTAEWITTRLPNNLKWAVAGRNEKKLQGVVDELKALSPGRKQPDILTLTLSPAEITTVATRARLIVTTIGPYSLHGEPILAACAASGTHYLDCTGEMTWVRRMITKYHSVAALNNAIIIPECGFDSAPADMTAFAVTQHIRREMNVGTREVIHSLQDMRSGVSGGTISSALQMFEEYGLKEIGESMQVWSISPVKPTREQIAQSPRGGSWVYGALGTPWIKELGGTQTVGVGSAVDACIVHRSWGLYEESSNSSPSSKNQLSYGKSFRFAEYMKAKNLFHGLAVHMAMFLPALLLGFPPLRYLLAPIIRKFALPGEGPAKASMADNFASFRAMGIPEDSDIGGNKREKVLASIDSAHGMYSTTGLTLAAAASVILRGRLGETEAGRRGGGILTPATLGEQYLERLNEFGLKIRVYTESGGR